MIKKKIVDLAFRIRVRKALSNSTNEQVQITYEEAKKMMERRKIKQ